MADKEESNNDDRNGNRPTPLFKMPIARSVQTVSKKDTVKLFEKDPEPQLLSTLQKEKGDDEETINEEPTDTEATTTNDKRVAFSPAERLKGSENPAPYREPSWSGISNQKYFFEAVKDGTVVDKIDLSSKSYCIFGRLPSCDHPMDHPSLSRYHAVVQYRSVEGDGEPVGWYLYDLDSTHGTWINKNKIKPRVYFRLRVGYVVKFGGSTRLYILQGPDSDQDEESQLSVTELKEQRERQKKEAEVLRNLEIMEAEELHRKKLEAEEDKGCSWGMDVDDPTEEDNEDVNPFALPESLNEALYIDDPKKSLRGFFEREGHELPEYEITDEGKGRHRCRVELPIETISGEPEIVEVTQEGKKKDVVVACALEACRLLDRRGLLRQSKHESRARKRKNWEDADFYDSDDDTFLDRTGSVEKKRELRMRQIKKAEKVDNYETLSARLNEVSTEMELIEQQLEKDRAEKQAAVDDGLDELDAFMMSMKSGGLDTKTKISLKHRLVELRQQKLRLERLVAVARPCQISLATSEGANLVENATNKPLFGKMKGGNKKGILVQRPPPSLHPTSSNKVEDVAFEEEEEEEEDDEDSKKKHTAEMNDTKGNVKVTTDNCVITKTECDDDRTKAPLNPVPDDHSSDDQKIKESKIKNPSKYSPSEKMKITESQTKSKNTGKLKSKAMAKHKELHGNSYDEYNDDYAMWLPPSAQSGDGKTSLNDKFGY